jgi:MSHA biogenesis protein MshO
MMRARRQRGFTLTELVLVIVITAILAVVLAPIITEPMRAYFDSTRRNDLAYTADAALRRMARDVHDSLPYSIRLNGSNTAFEMIRVRDVARYRESGGPPARRVEFNGNDTEFNILGTFASITARPYTAAATERLVVFNLGSAGFDAYAGDSVISSAGNFQVDTENYSQGGTNFSEDKITAINGSVFPFTDSSPSHRVFLVDGEVSYGCSGGQLFRISDYGFGAAMPGLGAISGGDVMADNISSCRFDYDPGSATRPGLLIMSLELTSGGENVRLLHQVHVPNAT